MQNIKLMHLSQLEAESIYIIREVIAEFSNPVMMYSIGKDSSVMLHLARKAFYPGKIPFPLLHIDTGWKFQDMYKFRDDTAKNFDLELLIHKNSDAKSSKINPFMQSSQYTDLMKTESLKQAFFKWKFDAAFGGARRDEERSRSKERIYSFRDKFHCWDPKNQRPELWHHYNSEINKGESMRIFPLSNWTELDIWKYIFLEKINIVPLYFSSIRSVLERNNMLIVVDDNRINLQPHEQIKKIKVRFRTLGCWPLTGAIKSNANTVPKIIQEMLQMNNSERENRLIDCDQENSMELKKRQGYF